MTVVEPRHRQNDTGINVRQRAFDGIAAFQHSQIGFQTIVQDRITLRRELHVRDRVGIMVVLTGRIDDQIRLEIVKQRHDDIVQRVKETFLARFRRHRQIDDGTVGIRTTGFIGESRTWIQGTAILMHGNKQGIGIMPENIL